MDAKIVLRAELENPQTLIMNLVRSMTADEWAARPYPSGAMLGFTAWHMPATVDWTLHTWLQDVPELRAREPFVSRPRINPPCTPFGMPAEQADDIARTVSRDDVVAYATAVYDAAIAWLDAASEEALTTPIDSFERVTSQPHQRDPGYIEEAESRRGRPAWRMLMLPCFGHVRGHLGELDSALTGLRSRP